ncbi:uncharacterized protein KGF55_002104 [Candida pseudojiufengensis]|uniref:uncharacterized protein n=1 Tax=Candida pseudojiufengensis TaxID=497109 RepID=UPI002223F26B|nr:uncharacterized protein KGF55_002104 [Candida pseudojiufengensis]KAI5964162.1 hypothetical protein KGF55_002104 [Candida pseudojiufengensis]
MSLNENSSLPNNELLDSNRKRSSEQPFNPKITQNGEKRIRVLTACDSCKKRKSKCDGENPCSTCKQSKKPKNCVYTERQIRKKSNIPKESKREKKSKNDSKSNEEGVKVENEIDDKETESEFERSPESATYEISQEPKPTNQVDSSNFEMLDKRMSKLVKVMDKMTKTMEILAGQVQSQQEMGSDKDSETNEETNLTSQENKKRLLKHQISANNNNNNTHTSDSTNIEFRSGHQYIGTHSILSIFSKQSLDWMEQTLEKDGLEYIRPVRNLPLFLHSKMKRFITKWIDPPPVDAHAKKKLMETPFPRDSKLIYEVIDVYYKELTTINVLVESSYIDHLFKCYYNNYKEPQKKKRFTLSELLIMTSVVLIGLNNKMDHGGSKESKAKLSKLLDSLTNNAIFYYQRLCIVSEGIETVEALLLFIIYLEFSWLTSHLNYIPVTIAIRYAQDLGLHRSDSFRHLSFQEQERRRRLWWFCYYFDTELCFRSGKPPTTNTNDVTTNGDEDMLEFCLSTSNAFNESNSDRNSVSHRFCLDAADEAILGDSSQPLSYRLLKSLKKFEHTDPHNVSYYHFFALLLARIKSKSYHSLFEAAAQAKDFDVLSSTLEDLNEEMFELARWSESEERPRFYHDPQFKFMPNDWSKSKREVVLVLQLTFFSHLMVINRFPFILKTKSLETDDRILKFRTIALDSARTILVLIKQLNKSNTTASFYNWLSYLPVSAFLILCGTCLNHPSAPEVPSDIRLLIESSLGFFDITGLSSDANTIKAILGHGEQDDFTQIFIKLMLRIVIKNYENKSRITDFSNDKKLQEHLNNIQTKFPELFKKFDNINDSLTLVGASLFDDSYQQQSFEYDSISNKSSSSNRVSPYVNSPRYNPSVSNIMHPDQSGQSHSSTSPSSDQSNYSMYPNQNLPQQFQVGPGRSSPLNAPFNQFHPNQISQDQMYIQPNASNVRSNHNVNLNDQNIPYQQVSSENQNKYFGNNVPPTPTQMFDNYDLLAQHFNNDGASNIILSQMNNMPNFFFDNNLGI